MEERSSIVTLPVKRVVCDDCQHAYLGRCGVFCVMFYEFVDASYASECSEFSP